MTSPTVQTSPATPVGGMLSEKLVQLSGNKRNSGTAGTQGTLGEELMQMNGSRGICGRFGAGTGTPRQCVAMSIVAQIAIPITAASLTDE